GAAGIADMLMQSRLGTVTDPLNPDMKPEIELLPALPSAWPSGSVTGLRARGGFEVDLAWRDGKLAIARIKPIRNERKTVSIRCGDRVVDLDLRSREVWLNADLDQTARPRQ